MCHAFDERLRDGLPEPWYRRNEYIGRKTQGRRLIKGPFAHIFDAFFVCQQALQPCGGIGVRNTCSRRPEMDLRTLSSSMSLAWRMRR